MQVVFLRLPVCRMALALAAVLCAAAPVAVQSAESAFLGSLARGSWTLRMRDSGAEQKICIRTGQELIQLRHRQSGCSQFVVRDGPEHVTIQYTCPGNGYGRTEIRRESSGVLQLNTQGIVDGSPFAFTAEARRTGGC